MGAWDDTWICDRGQLHDRDGRGFCDCPPDEDEDPDD
jgi:hypothetical protein